MRSILMAAMVAAGTTAYAAEPGTEDLQALLEAQQRQIELLQQQLDATQASLDQISQQVKTNTEASVEANEKAEILAENIESRPVVAESSTKLGGYGELHINMLEDQNSGEETNVLDFHRFVMFFQHDFNDRLRFNSELEIEHAYSGDGKPGAVELEQAYVEYDWADNHSFKAGLFLVPVGMINETHEPPTFYGTERNPVEKNIIPTTWWESGLAFNGDFGDALRYDFAAHSGLFTEAGDNYAIRAGRQKSAKARFDSQAYTGRLRWTSIPGLELAATVQYQEDITQDTDPTAGGAWLYSTHLAWQRNHFGLRALYADWSLDGAGPESIGADRQTGWYIEPSWRFNRNWGVFARYNSWDNQAGNSADTEYTQWDVGVNYWLHPNVVFKLDYQDQSSPDGKKELDGWNLGVGYQF
jgi:predicted porin